MSVLKSTSDKRDKKDKKDDKAQAPAWALDDSYVVWSNGERRFVESVGHAEIFYTDNLDDAFQFTREEDALDMADLVDRGVVFKWLP